MSSLLVMGIATFAIGLLPTYAQVGVLAPALLAVMRFAKASRSAANGAGRRCWRPRRRVRVERGWMAMWPQLGAPLGFLLANALFLSLINLLGLDGIQAADVNSPFYTWGWRIPFLLSAVMVAVGLYVRLKLTETPVFARSLQRGESRQGADRRLVPRQLGQGDHRRVRRSVHVRDLLPRHNLGVELRHGSPRAIAGSGWGSGTSSSFSCN